MSKVKLHEDCKVLSEAVYQKEKPQKINGWEYVDKYYNDQTGFYSEVYKKGDTVIFSIRGTEIKSGIKEAKKDIKNDKEMFRKNLPYQVTNAKSVYDKLVNKYGRENVVVTGHSLGGSIGAILGAEYGVETVTFNAYGIKNLYGLEINYTDNIINYGHAKDAVFVSNIDNHIGKVMVLNDKFDANNGNKDDTVFKYKVGTKQLYFLKEHFLETMGDLSKALEYNPENINFGNVPLYKLHVEYNDYKDEKFDLKNRVFYDKELDFNQEIDNDTMKSYIKQYLEKPEMPTKTELNKRVHIGNLIYIEEYTRSDGTKVSGYYRAYPQK